MDRMRRILCALVPLVLLAGCADAAAGTGPAPSRPSPSASPASAATSTGPDVAPHEVDNNGWKQRHDLTDADRAAGEQAAARIRRELQRLRTAGDFTLGSTRRTLAAIGYPATDIQVEPLRDGSAGAAFAVHAGRACVDGDVRRERVLVQVEGAATEFGCLEPFSH
jgi:hypothetical protein